ncbi:MAG: sodium:solute symporter family protein [Deltaproteobacteria bacterium]|nr:sodium:solute symporter family protein [Deltaproteobacteria bacterium]
MIDLSVIIAYFSVMLFVGWRSRRQSAESYWVAERRYRTGPVTASLVATIFGASSSMGIIGLGYSRGLTGAWWSLIGGIALIPFGLLLAGRVRALKVYTLPDILKKAYGERVAIPAGIVIAVAWCGVIAAQLIAGGRILSGIFSIEFQYALAVVAVVFVLYTFWGGQVSVIRTDSWQLFLFAGGLLVSLGFLFSYRATGLPLWENVPRQHLRFPVSTGFGWYDVLVFYPLVVGLPYLVGPDIYSRVLCAKDDLVARRSAMLAAAVVIPLSFILAFFGLLVKANFPGIVPEAALPKALSAVIPAGLKGLIVAGFLGAIMSSADTCLISASTILSLNVVGPFRRVSEREQLKVTRAVLVAVGCAAWLIASLQQGIISSLLLGYTVFVGGIVFPTLASFCQRQFKITSNGALWAIVVGGGAAIMGKIHGGAPMKAILSASGEEFLQLIMGPQYLSILPIVLCLVVMIGVSRITRSTQVDRLKVEG